MSLHTQQVRFSQMFAKLVMYAHMIGLEVVIATVARSKEEQARLVKAGASQTLKSKHVARLAGDLLVFKDGVYMKDAEGYVELGTYWKSLDSMNEWGGDWKTFRDYGHFQYTH